MATTPRFNFHAEKETGVQIFIATIDLCHVSC